MAIKIPSGRATELLVIGVVPRCRWDDECVTFVAETSSHVSYAFRHACLFLKDNIGKYLGRAQQENYNFSPSFLDHCG